MNFFEVRHVILFVYKLPHYNLSPKMQLKFYYPGAELHLNPEVKSMRIES